MCCVHTTYIQKRTWTVWEQWQKRVYRTVREKNPRIYKGIYWFTFVVRFICPPDVTMWWFFFIYPTPSIFPRSHILHPTLQYNSIFDSVAMRNSSTACAYVRLRIPTCDSISLLKLNSSILIENYRAVTRSSSFRLPVGQSEQFYVQHQKHHFILSFSFALRLHVGFSQFAIILIFRSAISQKHALRSIDRYAECSRLCKHSLIYFQTVNKATCYGKSWINFRWYCQLQIYFNLI